jgi:hypothetical protein
MPIIAVASFPSITVEPVEGATEIGMGSVSRSVRELPYFVRTDGRPPATQDYVYTAMMVDADIVGTNEMTTNQVRSTRFGQALRSLVVLIRIFARLADFPLVG